MKQSLMILSSLITLALVNNATLSSFNTTINTKLTSKTINVQPPTSLFNNTFGYLSQDSWITNQSTTDNKYYSYDTRHAVGNLSDGTSTRNAFLVDDSGNLIIKPELKLSDIDKNTLNNIQSEMINHKKVTFVKDFYNPYSKSVYSDSYFTGDNNNWKYLQFGGVEKHIDISKQQSANKVEYSNSLSETLGLYYIAKAVRDPNCIDMSVAENLGKYFISQSRLKNLDNSLTNTIINDIATNTNIYNLISSWPPKDGTSNLYKNYAIDYIFDSNNNLIQVYSYKWNNTIISNINATESNLDDIVML